MLIVRHDPERVERDLRAKQLLCPGCDGVLAGWGWARRRRIRTGSGRWFWLQPRRARCTACSGTHVLMPSSTLLRRADAVEVLGAALLASAAGLGHRRVAARLGVPPGTVRNWLRRFAAAAEQITVQATRLAFGLDPDLWRIELRGSPKADALEALRVAVAAAVRRFGRPVSGWHVVSALTAGRLLAPSLV